MAKRPLTLNARLGLMAASSCLSQMPHCWLLCPTGLGPWPVIPFQFSIFLRHHEFCLLVFVLEGTVRIKKLKNKSEKWWGVFSSYWKDLQGKLLESGNLREKSWPTFHYWKLRLTESEYSGTRLFKLQLGRNTLWHWWTLFMKASHRRCIRWCIKDTSGSFS